MKLPNVRKMFVPDSGYTIGDCDLDRADLQVVVWEAEDVELKDMLRAGIDIHMENAKLLYNTTAVSPTQRAIGKKFIHLTNYGGKARTCAKGCGLTIAQAEYLQRRWFQMHPRILAWHRRTQESLMQTRTVWNAFGFRRFYFSRIENTLPEALAWVPQSTVAIVINHGLRNIFQNLPQVQLLLQVHDSLVLQFPTKQTSALLPKIKQQLSITIPYTDPLVIGVGLKTSTVSWGDCKKVNW